MGVALREVARAQSAVYHDRDCPAQLIDRDVATANVNQVLIGGAVLAAFMRWSPALVPMTMQAE